MFWLLASTNLIAAALVFTIQPLVAKLALPLFGGSAMVWSTALMVFQGGLLLGYVYAHALGRLASATLQASIHGVVAVLSALALPIAFTALAPSLSPSLALTISLLAAIGLPYFVVCTTSPLTQRWYFEWSKGRGRDPYTLYSVSNAGSLLALLSYPFLAEPLLDTDAQRALWSWGYVLLLLTLVAFMFIGRGRGRPNPGPAADTGARIEWRQCARWILFAFVPSLYLMGVTLHIGIDVAAAPFVWILPLALYLLSFIVVFARPAWGTHPGLLTVQACVVIALCIYFFYSELIFLLILHLAGLFLACMVCHGRLVAERPRPAKLTAFYIWMALGGWLGGVVGALIAPLVFSGNWEYLLAIAAACLLRPTQAPGSKRADVLAPTALVLVLLALIALDLPAHWESYLVFGLFVIAVFVFRTRPLRFSLAVIPLLIANQLLVNELSLMRARSFYGIYAVEVDPAGHVKRLMHGTTLHGAQAVDPQYQVLPLEYYNPEGPLGQVMAARRDAGTLNTIGVVGLGVGTIACYALPHTRLTFFEIDPLIAQIAGSQFTYLDKCAPNARVIIGDGRLGLEKYRGEGFDVLIIDAFSSDAIPLHLLTAEAMKLYLSRLAPGGTLLVHISNRYVDLSSVLARVARANQATAYFQSYEPSQTEVKRGATASDWVWIATDAGARPEGTGWRELQADSSTALWTDRYSNLLDVIAWEKVLWF